MAGKTLETVIQISGALDHSVKKALDTVADNMDQLEAAARKAGGAAGELAGKISDQSKVLEVAQKKYASYVLAGEEGSEQAQKLASEIEELSQDLNRNKAALDAAEKAADRLGSEMEQAEESTEDLGEAARNTEGGFTVMKGAIANLISSGIEKLASACANAVSSLYGLAESTREYREDMGKLETAWESAGKSTELATQTYKNFYSVLGEEDRSVEAANHLAKFVETEKDMQKWTDICTGVWGTFGDSLPVEGLTEAANESVRVGQVTGVLADAINWAAKSGETFGVKLKANTEANKEWNKAVQDATSAEDYFNLALQQCSSEQERAALITSTLNGLYSEAAGNYRENNASIIESRLATSEYTDSLARLGEKIEPVTTAVTTGLNKLLAKALELAEGLDMDAVIAGVTAAFDSLCAAIDWVCENGKTLLPIIASLTAALAAYKISTIDVTAVTGTLKGALAALTSPVGLVVTAVAGLVAAFMHLWNTNEDFRKAITSIWNEVVNTISGFVSRIGERLAELGVTFEGTTSVIKAVWDGLCAILAPLFENAFTEVKNILTLATNTIVNIIDLFTGIFTGDWETAFNAIKNITIDVFTLLEKTFVNVVNAIKDIGSVILGWFGSNWKEAWAAVCKWFEMTWGGVRDFWVNLWNNLVSFITGVLKGIYSLFETIWNNVYKCFSTVWNQILNICKSVLNGIKDIIVSVCTGIKNIITDILNAIKNTVSAVLNAVKSIITGVWNGIKSLTTSVWNAIKSVVVGDVNGVKSAVSSGLNAVKSTVTTIWNAIKSVTTTVWNGILSAVKSIVTNIWNTIKSVFNGIKNTISSIFSSLKSIMLAPFNAVISIISSVSSKISGLLSKIGLAKSSASGISGYATGGFTNGISIAGEDPRYPTEAVISFNPAYRSANIDYWAQAGRMLGVTADDAGFSLSGNSGGTQIDMGGVTFAPNITIAGNADKSSIVKAIRDEYPEFLDMLEEWFFERGLPVYG